MCQTLSASLQVAIFLYTNRRALLDAQLGRALRATGWASRKPIQEALMKKLLPACQPLGLSSFARRHKLELPFVFAMSFFAGCAALDTHQARLDQKQLREGL